MLINRDSVHRIAGTWIKIIRWYTTDHITIITITLYRAITATVCSSIKITTKNDRYIFQFSYFYPPASKAGGYCQGASRPSVRLSVRPFLSAYTNEPILQ
jgi:hypothetical protein